MTFSTRAVCDAVRENFVPVWESVSDTSVARFDLGDGKSIQGTIGGEIMLYFCRPDGVVFDAVPALQSPAVVLRAIKRATDFYQSSGGCPDAAIRKFNQDRMGLIAKEQGLSVSDAQDRIREAHRTLNQRLLMGAPADDAMAISIGSKTAMVAPAETITVVEPGGYWLYALQVHDRLALGPLQSPMDWKSVMFEEILGQDLGVGGMRTFDASSVQPMSLQPAQGQAD